MQEVVVASCAWLLELGSSKFIEFITHPRRTSGEGRCSALITIVGTDYSRRVQFSRFLIHDPRTARYFKRRCLALLYRTRAGVSRLHVHFFL